MRLIDTDALKVALKKELLMESGVSQMVWSSDVLDVIDEAVEVDAIPVEWLKEQDNSPGYFMTIGQAIELWEKEKDGAVVRNEKKIGIWEPLGHRIGFMNHPMSEWFKCSLCGYEQYVVFSDPSSKCPECGATMKVGG